MTWTTYISITAVDALVVHKQYALYGLSLTTIRCNCIVQRNRCGIQFAKLFTVDNDIGWRGIKPIVFHFHFNIIGIYVVIASLYRSNSFNKSARLVHQERFSRFVCFTVNMKDFLVLLVEDNFIPYRKGFINRLHFVAFLRNNDGKSHPCTLNMTNFNQIIANDTTDFTHFIVIQPNNQDVIFRILFNRSKIVCNHTVTHFFLIFAKLDCLLLM